MSAKQEVRSETSSDSSNSPEKKRSREARNESILSETDDEVLEALEMAEDVGKKIDLILAKLSKLDNIESSSLRAVRGKFEFQRVLRLGKPKGNESRPTIARFLRYQDREEVLDQPRKTLRDKDYSVFEDMPEELYDLRKPQVEKTQGS